MSRLFSGTPLDKPPICPTCGNAPADCPCIKLPPKQKMSAPKSPAKPAAYALDHTNSNPPKDQIAKIRLERRKGNREVTLITGLEHAANNLPDLLTTLKTALATGGSVQSRTLELQGDHTTRAAQLLKQKGYNARVV
jgi:translation initiation factor 1